MRKPLMASALSLLCVTAGAADYFVVVPVKGRTAAAPAENIAVSLQAATLPAAMVGQAYNYNLRDHLLVTGDKALDLNQAMLTTADALPAGLSLAANGVLSGTPTAKNSAGTSFQVVATYKTQSGQQVYTLVVNGMVLNVTSLALGSQHTCAITTSGGVKCWGFNAYGQLGDGSTTNRLSPVDVIGLTSGVQTVVAGDIHSCALTNAGAVTCWGNSGSGQVGNGSFADSNKVPVPVTGLSSDVVLLSAGYFHNCAKRSAGYVYCWGNNSKGQLGIGSTVNQATPAYLSDLGTVTTRLASGGMHSCVVLTDRRVKCWGNNDYGQLGDGSTANKSTSVSVPNLNGVDSLSLGQSHSCALTTTGGVKCWGQDVHGNLGDDASFVSKSVPVDVAGLSSGVTSLSSGGAHTCAVASGALKCWGYDYHGQLGDDEPNYSKATPTPVLGMESGVSEVSAGYQHTCAKMASGLMKCWGNNQNGQLGDGTNTIRRTPVDVLP